MKNQVCLGLGVVVALATMVLDGAAEPMSVDRSPYLIAGSHDGNHHDRDDILATALGMGILGTAGAAKRFGISADVLFNVQAPSMLDAAAANFVAVSQRLGPDVRLYYACAGPMEVPWRMLSAVRNHDATKLQYIVCVSHSNWNENHNDTEALAHQWNDMVADFPEVKFHRISDQNTCDAPPGEGNDFYSALDKWDWLCKSENADGAWICTRNFKSGFDASDAGMYMYTVSGEAAKNKDRHVGGPQTSQPRHSYCATVQQCRWLFDEYTPPKD